MLFDSHCHLDAPEFDADRETVLIRARENGVGGLLLPAVEAAAWPKLAALCATHPELRPAYGLHPMYVDRHRPEHLDALRIWLGDPRTAAVGECGLDFFVPASAFEAQRQREIFHAQLRLAREFELPVVVHARRAVDEVIAMFRRVGGLRGVVHSFSGSEEQARQLWRLGFSLGIGGPVTFDRAIRLRRITANMPIEHLLLETDAPDQPDAAIRGQRNEPSRLEEIASCIAALRGVREDEIAAATTANSIRLFDRERD